MANKFLNYEGLTHFWGKLKALFDTKVDKVDGKGLSTNDYTTSEKTKLANIETGANKTTVENVLTSTSTTNALSAAQGKVLDEKIAAINTDLAEKGAGDMLKSVYDTNNSGVVDNAEKLGGQLPAYYATATSLTNLGNSVYDKDSADEKFADKATTLAGYGIGDAYTKTEVDDKIDALPTQIDVYNLQQGKADKATTLAGYGITDAYTKTETDDAIDAAFNDFATKVSDDAVVNTYKELIDYAADHGAEFTELVGEVDANTAAIAKLNGTLTETGSVSYTARQIVDAQLAAEVQAITNAEIDTIMAA